MTLGTFLTLVLGGAAVAALAGGPAPADQAVIMDSGSTNRAGFQITVPKSGDLQYAPAGRKGRAGASAASPRTLTAPADLVARFFTDLEAAQPIASLPAGHCMKSASFGSRLTVQYGADTTPDLSCGDGGDARLKALIADAQAIVNLSH